MSLLPDWRIRRDVKIEPFAEEAKRPGKISYGLSSYGYDIRVGYKFKIFTPTNCAVVDPKNFDPKSFVDVDITPTDLPGIDGRGGWQNKLLDHQQSVPDHILIPPNSFALAETIEYIEVPRNIFVLVTVKSTYARCAITCPSTTLEPEWKGKITLEISNSSSLPAKVYANQGLAQLLFFEANEVCEKSYLDKGGKYNDQQGLTLPFVV